MDAKNDIKLHNFVLDRMYAKRPGQGKVLKQPACIT